MSGEDWHGCRRNSNGTQPHEGLPRASMQLESSPSIDADGGAMYADALEIPAELTPDPAVWETETSAT
jgi:hypothetical protein